MWYAFQISFSFYEVELRTFQKRFPYHHSLKLAARYRQQTLNASCTVMRAVRPTKMNSWRAAEHYFQLPILHLPNETPIILSLLAIPEG